MVRASVGERRSLRVAARHHQAVARVGSGLIVSVKSSDGVIEALECPGLAFAVAVQWHPEDRILVGFTDDFRRMLRIPVNLVPYGQ